jgi:D-alanine-D-alanine ligase
MVIGVTSRHRPRVAVIFGGRSPEHGVSCISAGNVLSALDPDEFEVTPIGITRAGHWVLTSEDPRRLGIEGHRLPTVTADAGTSVLLSADPTMRDVEVVDARDGVRVVTGVDVVFPMLHGPFGEDGTIQGLLEMAGVPYVGAGVFASAAAMDKEFAKKLAAADGIPVGPYVVLRDGQSLSADDRDRLGLPVFVKPSRAGSSIGITKVHEWAALDAAVSAAREVDSKVLVEAAIVGREIECGVLEGEHGGPPEASVCGEIRLVGDREFYDFEAKYLDDVCEFDVPAHLPSDVAHRVRELAVRAYSAIDCAGLARVDFFVTPSSEIYLNEINTMPGFTSISLFPQMWAASGLDYAKLVSRLVRTALRSPRR